MPKNNLNNNGKNFWGTREHDQIFSGNKGTRSPPPLSPHSPPRSASECVYVFNVHVALMYLVIHCYILMLPLITYNAHGRVFINCNAFTLALAIFEFRKHFLC